MISYNNAKEELAQIKRDTGKLNDKYQITL